MVEKGSYGTSENGLWRSTTCTWRSATFQPVIAAVNGFAIGGGHVIHVLCDVTVAAEHASARPVLASARSMRLGLGLSGANDRREARPRDLVLLPAVHRTAGARVGACQSSRSSEKLIENPAHWPAGARLGASTALKHLSMPSTPTGAYLWAGQDGGERLAAFVNSEKLRKAATLPREAQPDFAKYR
jgi:naphthoate synthase